MHTAFGVRREGFVRLAQRSRPLVTAIRQFETKYGNPPDELSQLVPEFLNEVPKTGIGAYPEYEYQALPDKDIYRDNPWMISVRAGMPAMSWDLFLYFPKQIIRKEIMAEPLKGWKTGLMSMNKLLR
jgi:hypothetical protein